MADYYGSEGAADTYHAAHGNTAWAAALSAAKLAALLIASERLDADYASSFNGYPTGLRAQKRQWPRTSAWDIYGYSFANDEIPVQVQEATYELALRQIVKPGSLFKDWTAGKDIKSVSVDGAVSVTFAGAGSIQDVQTIIPVIDGILWPILHQGTGTMYAGSVQRT